MLPEYKKDALLRLRVAAGHLDAVRRMVEEDGYCIDLMKQLSAVQGTLARTQQVLLENHLSTCVSDAIRDGSGEILISELMAALRYDKSLIDGRGVGGPDLVGSLATSGPATGDPDDAASACCHATPSKD